MTYAVKMSADAVHMDQSDTAMVFVDNYGDEGDSGSTDTSEDYNKYKCSFTTILSGNGGYKIWVNFIDRNSTVEHEYMARSEGSNQSFSEDAFRARIKKSLWSSL